MALFEIEERDEAGNLLLTYVGSHSTSSAGGGRIDEIHPSRPKYLARNFLDVFLPVGYPHSVTADYTPYQIYDSLQAFTSSIAGLLASRAVLEGIGVGDTEASPTAALLLTIIQESIGRLATILFAHRLGTALEPECKRFRLLADVFNDIALIMDCLSPAFPKAVRVVVLSVASAMRALCGVAAGSSKASLSAHFARWGNLGELNAKDSSQETVISLLGMLAGSWVVQWVTSRWATWATLLALLFIHLATNYAAVRSVQMVNLNRQRANILFCEILEHRKVLAPAEVSRREKIFESDGALRWRGRLVGRGHIGARLREIVKLLGGTRKASTKSQADVSVRLDRLASVFANEMYLLWFDQDGQVAYVIARQGASTEDILVAWLHSLLLAISLHDRRSSARGPSKIISTDDLLDSISTTLAQARTTFDAYRQQMLVAGWDLQGGGMETRSGVRIFWK